jgi:hypothetical protein
MPEMEENQEDQQLQINWDELPPVLDIHIVMRVFQRKKQAVINMVHDGLLEAYVYKDGAVQQVTPDMNVRGRALHFYTSLVREVKEKMASGELKREVGAPRKDVEGDAYRSYQRNYYETVIKPRREAEKAARKANSQGK